MPHRAAQLVDPDVEQELRTLRALSAMTALETVLETMPPDALLPAGDVLALCSAVFDTCRRALYSAPRRPKPGPALVRSRG